ncbi:MAG: ATP-grasp domain-containing protein [Lachnospiraceae bacterium]|nr:ATP-grasp domain-containing protein [Lachnospiraceae bacterium]
MKKILLLGGSAQQVIAIETAKRLGLYTVLCDYLLDNPGQYEADRFYLVSTTDKEAVLLVAEKEKIDGIIAYASDPAAPTAAYVADKLGLPGNPYESVQTLCNKDKFRRFLKNNGFHAPFANGYSTLQEIEQDICYYHLPVIVKPVDSSGSKGATVLHSWNGLVQAVNFAFSFSRTHRLIMEEYIEKKHKYLIGGDIFVYERKVIQWGLMNCHRDSEVNPLVPVGKSYPLLLGLDDIEHVKTTLQRLVDKLGIVSGPMNVELIVDKNDNVWPIDIGPRSGGNMIPDLLGMIFDTDVVEMSVCAAMGMPINVKENEATLYYATHNLHTSKNGVFEGIDYSKVLKKHIVKECVYKKLGDNVEYFDNASKAIGIAFLKFDNQREMDSMLENINYHISMKIR